MSSLPKSNKEPFTVSVWDIHQDVLYTNEMPIELKEKWIEALRSGKYKQGQGNLYNNETDCYCVMGVLGRVGKLQDKFIMNAALDKAWCEDKRMNFPASLRCPILHYRDRNVSIMELNDQKILSFSELADLIEAQIEGV